MARVLAPGELLFRQGDRAGAIYKVETGRLRLIRRTIDDRLVILHTARRGEFFAEASLSAETYHCDAIAAVQSSVRVYPKEIVIKALRADPALAEAFMARLAYQLQDPGPVGVAQHPLGPRSRTTISATACWHTRSQHHDRGPASRRRGGNRHYPRGALSYPRHPGGRRVSDPNREWDRAQEILTAHDPDHAGRQRRPRRIAGPRGDRAALDP